jgi:hypothetical protein
MSAALFFVVKEEDGIFRSASVIDYQNLPD